MHVSSGSRLGPYEIVSPIGAGGMGEVWKGRDTRLERSVAIKVLPAEFAHNAQLKSRFEREAKTISQLNHPNICTLYDVGDDYLVMELLEGESLALRLEKGPLPIDDVFRYGAQIADALDRAHRAGIVHRDLKPANIMITKGGAKLLDFGLAKSAVAAVDVNEATQQRGLTQEGTIVGTFQYMAPEQLEGLEADARTDIFAFGALLYEMATGKRAFQGSTRTSLIAAIVGSSPRPLAELRPTSPVALEHIISKCLEKDPDDRWQSAHDIRQELLWAAEHENRRATEVRPLRRKALTAALAVSWLLLGAAVIWYVTRPAAPMTVSSLVAPEGFSFDGERGPVMISPDGRRIAFVAASETSASLFVRDLGTMNARALPGTEDAGYPFWSSDSQSIGFFSGGKLKTIRVDGGPAQSIADAPTARGGAWARDTIVFNASYREGLYAVPAGGGTPKQVTKLGSDEISHRWPAFLPDGDHVLFLAQRAEGGSKIDTSTIDVVSLKTGKRRSLLRANSSVLYAPPGYLLFWREKSLLVQELDTSSLELRGNARVVAENVAYSGTEAVIAAVSNQGTLIYQNAQAGKTLLVTCDRSGTMSRIDSVPPDRIGSVTMSHDGKKLAFSVLDQGTDVRVVDLVRGTKSRLTFAGGDEDSPVWSPDDTRIAFRADRRGGDGGDIFVIGSGGADVEQPLLVSPEATIPTDWSPDGKSLLLEVNDAKEGTDIWLYSFENKRATPLIRTPFRETEAVFSPDGNWIAYSSDQSGLSEVYVQRLDGGGSRLQASNGGGTQPLWRRDGAELFFISPDHQMFAVAVKQGPEPELSTPTALFAFREPDRDPPDRSYSVSPDGQRFAILTSSANSGAPVTLVQNWTHLLRK